MSVEDFEIIAKNIARPYKRLIIIIDIPLIYGTVRTSSGISSWEFVLDFNDFGQLTGQYWFIKKENIYSTIPINYANELKTEFEKNL